MDKETGKYIKECGDKPWNPLTLENSLKLQIMRKKWGKYMHRVFVYDDVDDSQLNKIEMLFKFGRPQGMNIYLAHDCVGKYAKIKVQCDVFIAMTGCT